VNGGEDPLHFLELAAHDGGVEAVARDRRIGGEDALCGAVVHAVLAFPADVMVPAGGLEKGDDALGTSATSSSKSATNCSSSRRTEAR
jgi:hypothetical protein